MSTKVRNLGWNVAGSNVDNATDSRRNVLSTSDGRVFVVMADGNASGAASGYGSHDNAQRIYLYESTDRSAWTLRATITPATTMEEPYHVMAELFSDDSIGIIYKTSASGWRYVKVTDGTWSVGSHETVVGSVSWTTSGSWVDGDIAIGNGDVPMFIGAYKGSTSGDFYGFRVYTRRTSDSTWVQSTSLIAQSTNALKSFTHDVTMATLDGGSSSSRPIVMAIGGCSSSSDNGVKLYTGVLNESTGAMTSVTLRSTYMTDEIQVPNMTWTNRPRKSYLFRSGVNEFFFGIMTWKPKTNKKPRAFAMLGSWNASTYSVLINPRIVSASVPVYSGQDSLAMTFGSDVANFISRVPPDNSPQIELINVVCQVNRADDTFDFSGHFQWNNNADPNDTKYLFGGSGRNYNRKDHDMVYGRRIADNKWELYHHYAVTPRAPQGVIPAAGANVTSSTPALQLLADLDLKYPQSRIKARWQLATNSGFTTNLRDYTQADSKFLEVRNTDAVNSYQYIKDTLPEIYSLSAAPWYIRGAHVDEFGHQSAYTAANLFNIAHPPVAVNLSPKNTNVVFTTGDVEFNWDFSDPYILDSQTAFQLVVIRNDTGATIYDSTKLTSGASSHSVDLTGFEELELSWWVFVWDEDDTIGAASEIATFYTVIPPTIGITVPASGGTVVTPMPNVQFGGAISGGRSVKQFRVAFTQGSEMIFQSAWIAVSQVGTYAISYTPPTNILENAENYTITARVRDSYNLENAVSIPITTAWTPPANPSPVTVDTDPYNTENEGWVAVIWNDSDRDADFRSWNVYRKSDEIDELGAVVEEGEYEKVAEEFDTVSNYEFRDYFAPSGHKVSYKVTQLSSEFNELIESSGTVVVSFPVSDGYWLIDETPEDSLTGAFRMTQVTDDQYTDEWEEDMFAIIGRGRHVDRGTHLGLAGTLTVKLRDTGGTTARQKKRRLEAFKKEVRDAFLRTPFGDTYWVSVGNIGISRIAGVALHEFCDATIPYSEVGVT